METSIQVSPSPVKIHRESHAEKLVDTFTVGPVEDCSSNVVKQFQPRDRTTSSASSINSSETSDSFLGGGMGNPVDVGDEEEEAEGLVRAKKSAGTITQSLKMQSHLRDMQRRVEILQGLMQKATQQGSLCSHCKGSALDTTSCSVLAKTMEKSSNKVQLAEIQALVTKKNVEESLGVTLTSLRMFTERTLIDEASGSKDGQMDCSSISCDEKNPFAITALVHCIKTLQVQLKEVTDENKQLQNTVEKLEQANARLQAQTAFHAPVVRGGDASGSNSLPRFVEPTVAVVNEIEYNNDSDTSRLPTAIFGVPSSFQRVMEEDLGKLKDHARCQHKLHELWDSVRQLKMFVETYEIQRNDMRVQRDEAIAEAKRADVENIRLVSCNNLQQKIKYLQQMKKDNEALRRKNRALNERLVKETLQFVREKNGCLLHGDGVRTIETMGSAWLHDTFQEINEPFVRTSEEILRRMWNFSRHLEQRLERLRLARQILLQGDDDSSESLELDDQMSVVSAPLSMIGYLRR